MRDITWLQRLAHCNSLVLFTAPCQDLRTFLEQANAQAAADAQKASRKMWKFLKQPGKVFGKESQSPKEKTGS